MLYMLYYTITLESEPTDRSSGRGIGTGDDLQAGMSRIGILQTPLVVPRP